MVLVFVAVGVCCLLINNFIDMLNINSEKNTARNDVLIMGTKKEMDIAPTIIKGTIALTCGQSTLWFL